MFDARMTVEAFDPELKRALDPRGILNPGAVLRAQ